MRFPALLAALAAAAAEVVLDRSQPGMDLLSPQVFESENGALAVTLRVGVVTLKMPTATFKTRLYNGQLPGPTLLVRPGDVVTVTLINDLEDIDNDENFNNLQRPNSTNMHFHGLHESPNAPGDDVFVEVLFTSVESILPFLDTRFDTRFDR
ncbi:hypothetical protein M885DRAFT_497542 [Pelagophyceae sp. CCMP2097]|nr:hypothetical protein M885DRAFT_497542 [Pelagophyceae sp. CCMP2097]